MFLENRIFRHFDFAFLASVLLLIACGLLAIYSATYVGDAPAFQLKFTKQLLWATIGLAVLAVCVTLPLKFFQKYAYVIYSVALALLVVVLVVGTGAGTRRWIALGAVRIQPAEIAKVATLIALARYLGDEHRNLGTLKDILVPLALVSAPLLLVMKQPDLGSALVFLALILPVLHWAGLSGAVLFVILAPLVSLVSASNYYAFLTAMFIISAGLFLLGRGLRFFVFNFVLNIGVGILTPMLWGTLKAYQQNRILTFLGLVTDPHGLGYQVIQSKVAIGSGGVVGKGFLHGTQTHLRFLPEQHTDFIFCVIAEEFGFLGVLLVLSLFLYMLLRGLNIASKVKARFSSVLVFGGTVIFLFQIFVNVGMTIGIMPVTGLPLPFLSYGGSALIANLMIVGLILNAWRKRFDYF